MTLGTDLNTSQMVAALLILKRPELEGRLDVTVRQDRVHGRLYAARRKWAYDPRAGAPRVKLHWSADLRRPDLQSILRRAADAAVKVLRNETNADVLQEVEHVH